jgi:hypothetical protein
VQTEALGAALRQRRGEAATAVTGRVVLDAEQAEEMERRMHAVTAAVRIKATPSHCQDSLQAGQGCTAWWTASISCAAT